MSRRPGGIFKKPAIFASDEAVRLFGGLSKQALLDMVYTACQLGTNETDEEIITKMAREALIVLPHRGDFVAKELKALAERHIDSDGEVDHGTV